MPQDALLQNADSYATAQVHKSTWFSDTLTPLAQSLAEPLNEQVFKRLGYRFEFRPETADPDMEEERQRVASAEVLFNILKGGNRKDADKAALEALGIDLPQWFTWEENEEEPVMQPGQVDPFGNPNRPQAPKPNMPQTQVDDGEDEEDEEEEKSVKAELPPVVISVPALREMQNWQDLAFRNHRKGLPLTFEWEARDIPADIADGIRARLATATDEAGIKAAFEVTTNEPEVLVSSGKFQEVLVSSDPEIKTLADALNNMAAAMMVQPAEVKADMTPVPQPITINLTAQMPAPGTPTVTVNGRQQRAELPR